MSSRSTPTTLAGFTAALGLLALVPATVASQSVVEAGAVIPGDSGIDSRNERIEVGPDAMIEGPVRSRNGRITIGAGSEVGAISTRNGRVELGADVEVAGGVETYNGRVELGDHSAVQGPVETRNGSVTLGEEVRVEGGVATRNGRIRLGEHGRVRGDLTTRNGGVELAPLSRVEGRVESRNGSVSLEDAFVGRDVDVHTGNVDVLGASTIRGDLVVLMPEDGLFSWLPFVGAPDDLAVRIDGDAVIGGRLVIDERIDLEIAPGADVPEPERPANREAWPGR